MSFEKANVVTQAKQIPGENQVAPKEYSMKYPEVPEAGLEEYK